MITAEDILSEKNPQLVTISPDATIIEAVEKMVSHRIGVILIKTDDQIVGIWSERDLLRCTLEPEFDPRNAKIADHMQTRLKTAPFDTPILKLEEMFLGLFIRHILITKNDQYLGLLSIGDVLRASLFEKDREIRSLHAKTSWEYYENWAWHRKQGNKNNQQ